MFLPWENLLKQNIELTAALLNQKSAAVPEILSPDSSPDYRSLPIMKRDYRLIPHKASEQVAW